MSTAGRHASRGRKSTPFSLHWMIDHAKAHVIVLSVAAALVIGVVDWVTGIEIAFTLLYLGPIALVAWWRGRRPAVVVAALSAALMAVVDILLADQENLPLHPWRLVWNHGGSLVLFAVVAHLVDRLRAYADAEQKARRAAVEQLRQAERLGVVGKLASGLAHELGTPLNVIIGHAELVDSPRATPAVIRSSSAAILAQAEKMTAIIRGLLDFARRTGSEKSEVDLAALARGAAALLKPVAVKRDLAIVVDASPPAPITVHGNVTELEQVLVNLMMNGLQAMSAGGKLQVRVRTERRAPRTAENGESTPAVANGKDAEGPPTACVDVEDDGSGISPESLPQIFDPFFTTKDVGEGTGLGLSVSYGIVSDHGGEIAVESSLGVGSRFSVYLPLRAPPSRASSRTLP